MSVHNDCRDYFRGFQQIGKKNNAATNAVAALKILSYLTGIAPAAVGIVYAISKPPSKSEEVNRVALNKIATSEFNGTVFQIKNPIKEIHLSQSIVEFQNSVCSKGIEFVVPIKVSYKEGRKEDISFTRFDNLYNPTKIDKGPDLKDVDRIEIKHSFKDIPEAQQKLLIRLGAKVDKEGDLIFPENTKSITSIVGNSLYTRIVDQGLNEIASFEILLKSLE